MFVCAVYEFILAPEFMNGNEKVSSFEKYPVYDGNIPPYPAVRRWPGDILQKENMSVRPFHLFSAGNFFSGGNINDYTIHYNIYYNRSKSKTIKIKAKKKLFHQNESEMISFFAFLF